MGVKVQYLLRELAEMVDPYIEGGQKVQDSTAAVVITGASDNGAGLIRIAAPGHGLESGYRVCILGVIGTIEANNTVANPNWAIERVDADNFDLLGSAFVNAWTFGGTVTGALVCSVDGDSLTRSRLVDIYNRARTVFAYNARIVLPPRQFDKEFSGAIRRVSPITFAGGTAPLPEGYISSRLLLDPNKVMIPILTASDIAFVQSKESPTNRFVLEESGSFSSLSGDANILTDGSYKLWYVGLPSFSISDVVGYADTALAEETINFGWHGKLLEVAAAIFRELGGLQLDALTQALISGGKNG